MPKIISVLILSVIQLTAWSQDLKPPQAIQKEEVILNRQTQPSSIQSPENTPKVVETTIQSEKIQVTKQTLPQLETIPTAEQTDNFSVNFLQTEEILHERQSQPGVLQPSANPK